MNTSEVRLRAVEIFSSVEHVLIIDRGLGLFMDNKYSKQSKGVRLSQMMYYCNYYQTGSLVQN